jgi:hypothetical protein
MDILSIAFEEVMNTIQPEEVIAVKENVFIGPISLGLSYLD